MKKEKLHIIAPNLSEISLKKSAFKVPDNYLETTEDEVIAKIYLQKIVQKNSTSNFNIPTDYFNTIEEITLTKLKAEAIAIKNNAEIPSDYFETFEDRVLTKVKASQKVISLKQIAKYMAPLAVAASLLLFFILNTNTKKVTFDSLATSEIEQFIESGLVDINAITLAETFSEIDLSTNNLTNTISDEEVLDYLTVEDIENIIFEN